MSTKSSSKNVLVLIIIAVVMVVCIIGGSAIISQKGKSKSQISHEAAMSQMEKKLKKIDVKTATAEKAPVEISNNLADELPDIDVKYPLGVIGNGDLNIEIFSSPEKASKGTDGWLLETAEAFNKEHIEIGGRWATVSIRSIASGAAVDYIISNKYVPQAYTPSNTIFGELIKAQGVDIRMERERMVGNTAGILINKKTYKKLQDAHGGVVDINTIIQATIDSEITMGYTNPYSSSTGINFLLSALKAFDSTDLFSDASVEKFQKFQANVPFVAYTTLQMRDAADSGVLDAFLMEYQGMHNTAELRDYEFVPFGMRHDNPMYAVGTLRSDEQELLKQFTDYCQTEKSQKLASQYGFNYQDDYKDSTLNDIKGDTVLSAQHLWKTEKDSGKPVMAVFIADVSGSMAGAPLQNLQTSLINASQYINTTNYVGLVSYSTNVTKNLPIAKFDLNQRSYFTGAVQSLSPSGSTATYDAVLVGLDMLMEEKAKVEAETGETIKPLLFVLGDGETNVGNDLKDIRRIVEGLEVPCYTIGYNANLSALTELSSINEAASINADNEDVVYSLKSLFNAQM